MRRALCLWIALVAAPALAGPKLVVDDGPPPDMVAVAEALEQANSGDRKGAIRAFTKVLEKYPANVDAHVGRGVNYYMIGDNEKAEEDLSHAFNAKAWEIMDTATEGVSEVTTTINTLDLVELRKTGASMLVVMAARDGDPTEGARVADKARETFGSSPQLLAATARLELQAGESEAAWKLMMEAIKGFDPTLFVQSVASEMVALDPEHAPPVVSDWLKEAGQWTAHYNTAIGHLRARRYDDCVLAAAEGLVAFPNHSKMLGVGYPCAARADLQRAEEWLLASGGGKKAEPWSVIAHARTLRENERPDDALALLKRMPNKLMGELPGQRETLALDILLENKRLDEAMHWSTGQAPLAEANVGYALIGAERFSDAVKLLTGVCPALKGTAGQSSCDQMLEYATANK